METTVGQSSEALTRVAVMRAGSRLISHVFGVYDRVRNVQRFLHLFTELLFIVGGGASAPASWLRRDRVGSLAASSARYATRDLLWRQFQLSACWRWMTHEAGRRRRTRPTTDYEK